MPLAPSAPTYAQNLISISMLYALVILVLAVTLIAQDYAEWADVHSLFTDRSAGRRGAVRHRSASTPNASTFEQEVEGFVEDLHAEQRADFRALQQRGVISADVEFVGRGSVDTPVLAEGRSAIGSTSASETPVPSTEPLGGFAEAFRRLDAKAAMEQAHEIRGQSGCSMSTALSVVHADEAEVQVDEGLYFQYQNGQYVGLRTETYVADDYTATQQK